MLRTLICCAFALLWTPAFAETGPQDIECISPAENTRAFAEAGATTTTLRGRDAKAFVTELVKAVGEPPVSFDGVILVTIHMVHAGENTSGRVRFYDGPEPCGLGVGVTVTAQFVSEIMGRMGSPA